MMMGPDMTGLYILVGIGFLLAGLIAMAKIGLWFWLLTNFFSPPGHQRPAPPPKPASSSIKTWLSIIATVLGIVSTSVGLLKKCESEPQRQPPRRDYEETRIVVPERGQICCTHVGNCQMMMPAQVGVTCTCFDILGNMAQGEVCR